MMGEEVEEAIADYLFDMDEMACFVLEDDIQGIDSMGIYLHIPNFDEADWGMQPDLTFYGDAAQQIAQEKMAEIGVRV